MSVGKHLTDNFPVRMPLPVNFSARIRGTKNLLFRRTLKKDNFAG